MAARDTAARDTTGRVPGSAVAWTGVGTGESVAPAAENGVGVSEASGAVMGDMLVLTGEGVPFAAGMALSVVVGVPLTPVDDVALAGIVTVAAAPAALAAGVGEAAGVLAVTVGVTAPLTVAVGVTMLVAVTLMLDDGAGVPDAVVVPVGVGVVLARMGVAPSWAITMSSSASSRPTRRRSVMNEFSLAYERCHSPHRTRAIILGGQFACLHVIKSHN